MILLLALVIPLGLGLIIKAASGKKITPKELALQEAAVAAFVGIVYALMLCGRTGDVELLNGSIAEKHRETVGCCHSYSCNCHEVCSGSGQSRSCSKECQTCYEHSHDVAWEASATTGKVVFWDTCNRPHSSPPARWGAIYVGEPTAEEHAFTNYIKGNPASILRRGAVSPALLAQVPEYPAVFDYYRARRFIDLGVAGVDVAALDHELSFINAQLGAKRQVNIIVIVTREPDPTFAEAVRQKWLGGKKNDVVVVVGAPAFPAIGWVDVVSWTQEAGMKLAIRDAILGLGQWDGGKALGIVAYEVDRGFRRRHMRDFQYLEAGIEPTGAQALGLLLAALVLSLVLSVLTYKYDLFGEETKPRRYP